MVRIYKLKEPVAREPKLRNEARLPPPLAPLRKARTQSGAPS